MNLRTLERKAAAIARNEGEAAVARKLLRYAGRPDLYADEYLRSGLTPKQREILSLLDKPPYRVLARSANTQGKTYVGAVKCSHFYDTVRPSITLVTAPTYVQVRDLAFKELRTLRPSSHGFAPKDTRLQSAPDHFVHGFTAAKADAFHGRHGVSLGLWFDEATGIDPEFIRRGETMFESTGRHWWLMTYNPNDSASVVCGLEDTGTWHVVGLSALEHPNILAELQGLPAPIPAAVRLDTVLRRMTAECAPVESGDTIDPALDFEFPVGSGDFWRPLTPEFEAQILGRWPASPSTALFSPYDVDRCFGLQVGVNPLWQVAIGCDVARFGNDKTAIAVRCGPCLLRLETHSKLNTTQIADRLRTVARETFSSLGLVPDASTSIPIFIDDTGGYGAGVVDQAQGYRFIGVNAASLAIDTRYPNTRTQMWCDLAAMAKGGALDLSRLPLNDRQTVKQELTAARYVIDAAGRRRLDSKAKIKEQTGRSPDSADAICLAYYLATSQV
jgi:hypothetical protein